MSWLGGHDDQRAGPGDGDRWRFVAAIAASRPNLPRGADALVVSLRALIEAGAVLPALDFLERRLISAGSARPTPVLDDSTRLLVGVTYLTALLPERGLVWLGSLGDSLPDRTRAAVGSARAFAFSLLGASERARVSRDSSRRILADDDSDTAHAFGLVGQLVEALDRADLPDLDSALLALSRLRLHSSFGRRALEHLLTLRGLLDGGHGEALRSVRGAARNEEWAPPGSRLGSCFAWVTGVALLEGGRSGNVLAIRDPEALAADHLVCLPTLRALAWIALGQDRLAELEFAPCDRLAGEHNQRTATARDFVRATALRHRQPARAGRLRERALASESGNVGLVAALLPDDVRGEFDVAPAASVSAPTINAAITRQHRIFRQLSPRELAVLAYGSSGASPEELASLHHVSINTVRTQFRTIYRKIGASSRREALDVAASAGLTPATGDAIMAALRTR